MYVINEYEEYPHTNTYIFGVYTVTGTGTFAHTRRTLENKLGGKNENENTLENTLENTRKYWRT